MRRHSLGVLDGPLRHQEVQHHSLNFAHWGFRLHKRRDLLPLLLVVEIFAYS